MARGNLPEQVPDVPANLFFAFNDVYLWLASLNRDMQALEAILASGAQVPIQFKEDGVNLGTPGTAISVDFAANLVATRVGDAVTVNGTGGGGGGSLDDIIAIEVLL
jgi:hypothetical protein